MNNNFLINFKELFLPTKHNNFRPFLVSNEAIIFYVMLFLVTKTLFGLGIILTQKSSLFAEVNAQKIILLTNDIRKQYSLPSLRENNLLDKAAQEKARDMIRNKYFAHYSPLGTSPWHWIDKVGYNYHYAGENLAMNFLDSKEVMEAWLNSPKHKENLLNSHYRDIGVAVVPGVIDSSGKTTDLVVQMFGSPMRSVIARAQATEQNSELTTTTTKVYRKNITTTITSPSLVSQVQVGVPNPSSEAEPKYEGEATSTNPSKINTSSISIKLGSNKLPKNSSRQFNIGSLSRRQIAETEKTISMIMVLIGIIITGGILNEHRKYDFTISELLIRSVIIILIGLSFSTFNILSFVGQLKIY